MSECLCDPYNPLSSGLLQICPLITPHTPSSEWIRDAKWPFKISGMFLLCCSHCHSICNVTSTVREYWKQVWKVWDPVESCQTATGVMSEVSFSLFLFSLFLLLPSPLVLWLVLPLTSCFRFSPEITPERTRPGALCDTHLCRVGSISSFYLCDTKKERALSHQELLHVPDFILIRSWAFLPLIYTELEGSISQDMGYLACGTVLGLPQLDTLSTARLEKWSQLWIIAHGTQHVCACL